jgi:hypothetical protein
VLDHPERGRSVTVEVQVTNTGDRAGTEVVQVYVPERLGSHPAPLNTLRGATVARDVAPGATVSVAVHLDVSADASLVRVGRSADPTQLVDVVVTAP